MKAFSTVLSSDVLSLAPAGGSLAADQSGCPAELHKTAAFDRSATSPRNWLPDISAKQVRYCS